MSDETNDDLLVGVGTGLVSMSVPLSQAVNSGVDPDGNARPVRVDREGYVIPTPASCAAPYPLAVSLEGSVVAAGIDPQKMCRTIRVDEDGYVIVSGTMPETRRCGTCFWWVKPICGDARGRCDMIDAEEQRSPRAYLQPHREGSADMCTTADFGCGSPNSRTESGSSGFCASGFRANDLHAVSECTTPPYFSFAPLPA